MYVDTFISVDSKEVRKEESVSAESIGVEIPLELQKAIVMSLIRTEPEAALANAYVLMGKTEEARKKLRQLEDPPRRVTFPQWGLQ